MCLFLLSFLGCFLSAQGGPKGSPKWSKIDEKEVQKRYLKKGTKKGANTMFFMTLECGSSAVNSCKVNYFQCSVLGPFWVSFWRCFGRPNGGQEHQKEVLKSLSILGRKNDQFLIDFGVPLGFKMEPTIDQKSIIFQVGVPEGPRGRFWKDFRPFWELF